MWKASSWVTLPAPIPSYPYCPNCSYYIFICSLSFFFTLPAAIPSYPYIAQLLISSLCSHLHMITRDIRMYKEIGWYSALCTIYLKCNCDCYTCCRNPKLTGGKQKSEHSSNRNTLFYLLLQFCNQCRWRRRSVGCKICDMIWLIMIFIKWTKSKAGDLSWKDNFKSGLTIVRLLPPTPF